jgi:hypothetical protein
MLSRENHPVHRRSPYNELKQLPKRPTRGHLNDLLAHLRWLISLGAVEPYLDSIPAAKVQHFAALAKALDAGELKDIAQPKRVTLLLVGRSANQWWLTTARTWALLTLLLGSLNN